jgi:glycosyltransferase involved in cell wall biosynthesis
MSERVLFLTQSGRRGASSRYRVFQFLPVLAEAGVDARVLQRAASRGRGIARAWAGLREEAAILRAARAADVVFVQKRLFRARFVARLRRAARRLVFDFDDSIFTSPKGNWSASTRRRTVERLGATLASADLVIVGNRFLADYAGRYAARVEVLPTVIDTERYRPKEHRDQGKVVVGWIGNAVNHRYLDMLSEVLPQLAQTAPGLELLVISDRDYSMPGVTVENRRWSERSEVDDLLDMDIGIMPLEDNDWTRGKCALKALQYMAAGLPVVCSAVGANREVVSDGVDGYLAADAEQWRRALATLAASADLRARMGRCGRDKVQAEYSIESCAPKLADLLRSMSVVEGRRRDVAQ